MYLNSDLSKKNIEFQRGSDKNAIGNVACLEHSIWEGGWGGGDHIS